MVLGLLIVRGLVMSDDKCELRTCMYLVGKSKKRLQEVMVTCTEIDKQCV